MWYVAQVQAGRESSTLEMCRRLVPPSVMEDCFMPEYEVMWKIRGEWRLVKRLLFPGYLFFVTDDPEALNRELSRVPMPIRLLGNEENSFFPLTGKERDWFLVYCFRHFSRSGRALYLPFQIWDKGRVEGGGRRTTSWDLALDDRIAPPTRSVTWIRQDGRSGLDI